MDNNSFVVLFDYDSMIYKAVWHIASRQDIEKWFKEGRSKEWMRREIVSLTINRLSNMGDAILLEIEDTGINIDSVEYFLTSCPDCARRAKFPEYKANRKGNKITKWVRMVRAELLSMGFARVDSRWEADDLIKDRAVQIGDGGFVIATVDKDLKQIPGIFYDYYRPEVKKSDGTKERGPSRGLHIVSKYEAKRFFWKQMLTGDATDNIPGIPRVGPKTAEKVLKEAVEGFEKAVLEKYKDKFGEDEGKKQFELHKLLIGLGVEHRP